MGDLPTIAVQCPACHAGYELNAADVGEQVECVCGEQFVVPQPASQTLVPVTCPQCGSVYETEPDVLGENVECQCGTVFLAAQSPPAPATAYVPQHSTPEAAIAVTCPACTAEYELEAELAGQEVECACGQRLIVPATPAPGVAAVVETVTAEPPAPVDAEPTQPETEPEAEPAPAPTARASETAPVRPTSTVASKFKQKQPDKRASGARPWIIGGCTAAAAAVVVVFVMSGSEDKPRPRTDATRTTDRVEPARELDRVAADAVASTEDRTSLADRMKQQESESAAGPSLPTEQEPGTADSSVADTLTSVVPEGSDNPNQLTKRDEFVISGGSPSTGPTTSTKRSVPSDTPPPGATASTTTPTAEPQTPATPTVPTETVEKPTSPPEPAKRIEFPQPKRQYRRFKDAATASIKLFASMRSLKTASASGTAADISAWEAELAKTGGMLKQALRLIDVEADIERVVQMRLLLAYCYLEAGQLYEAGILGHAIARWTPPDMVIEPKQPEAPAGKDGKPKTQPAAQADTAGEAILAAANAKAAAARRNATSANVDPDAPMRPALEAASLALAAFVQAFEASPQDDRTAEFNQLIELATLFDVNWSDDEKTDSIRLFAAQLHQMQSDRPGAADWYARVSKTSPNYARSRLMAGQACWTEYLDTRNAAADTNPESIDISAEPSESVGISIDAGAGARTLSKPAGTRDLTREQLKARAEQFLTQGVAAAVGQANLAKNVVVAKLTLGQMHLNAARYTDAVTALTDGEPSVIGTIGDDNESRPDEGLRSVGFATIAYTTLIRSYLGAGRLDEARAAMNTLQQIAGTGDAASLAKLHLDLSAEMTESYRQLAADGTQDIELLATIAKSLAQVVANASGLSAASLLKAARAATDLADTVTTPDDARLVYGQAASLYEALLATGLPDPDSVKAVQFQLARVLGRAARFEDSLNLYAPLLADQPNVFDAQMAAAAAMQAWGTDSKDTKLLVHAISGDPDRPQIWGWSKMSSTLQNLWPKNPTREDYRDRFLQTRLHIAECRFEHAQLLPATKKKEELNKALKELGILARTSTSFESPGWPPLDDIYQSIQRAAGQKPGPLYPSRTETP